MIRKHPLLLLVGRTIAAGAFTGMVASAQVAPDWSSESAIPHQTAGSHCGGAVANNMVVTGSGRLYIFYVETSGASRQVKFLSTDDRGATWSTPQLFQPTTPMPPGTTSAPSVAIDENDVIHCAWKTPEPALYYVRYHTANGTWSHQQTVSTSPRFGEFTYHQVMADRAGRVHLFWQDGNHENNSTPAESWYARMPAGNATFDTPFMLSADDSRHSAFPTADLSGVTGDRIAVAWRNAISGAGTPSADWDIQMRVSDDGGASWGTVQTAAGGALREWDPQLVVSRTGVIHLAFHQYDASLNTWVHIGHSADGGATWQNHDGASGFLKISPDGEQHRLCKSAYDFAHDIVWYFWKRDYRPGEDIIGTWVLLRGRHIETGYEYLTDVAPTSAAGYHNFAAAPDGYVHATYQIGSGTDPNTQATIYHRSRPMPSPLGPTLREVTLSGDDLQATFDSEFAVTYQVETSTDLAAWTDFGAAAVGTGEAHMASVPLDGQARLFMRLRASR